MDMELRKIGGSYFAVTRTGKRETVRPVTEQHEHMAAQLTAAQGLQAKTKASIPDIHERLGLALMTGQPTDAIRNEYNEAQTKCDELDAVIFRTQSDIDALANAQIEIIAGKKRQEQIDIITAINDQTDLLIKETQC